LEKPSATALYLAHLNPVTKAHVEIINDLKEQSSHVKVMPVVFRSNSHEINSKSFPFSYDVRKKMLQSVFGDSIVVTDDYSFFAPFCKYLPPLLSPRSWKLRSQVLRNVRGDFFTYTGDKAEGYMLKLYRLNPKIGTRKEISAASVKEKLYEEARGRKSDWQKFVPEQVVKIIDENWDVIVKFASSEDKTTRVAGMKFPKEGYWSK